MEYEELPWPVKIDILKSEIESLNAQQPSLFIRMTTRMFFVSIRIITEANK